ncbi:protein DBF4 B [Branchiostoma belcheri]|nr:protein DBF4 B [Branchiostoma belcheri]
MALGTPGSAAKVRRRLDFVKKPLEGESLYLDLPGFRSAKELEGDLKFLGARIETFLSRDISYVVTNRKEALASRPGGGGASPSPYLSPSPSPSPGVEEGRRASTSVPLTRGQALLQKAQGRGRRGSCNMLGLAQEWGVKVLYVRDVMARVQRLMEKYRLLAESEENAACPAEENADAKPKRLKPPFIKVEDMSRLYRPLHHEFTTFPRVYFDADADCPFDAPVRRLPSRPSCSLKLKPQTPVTATKPDVQKGYCECCEVYYQEGLTLHLKGDKHKSFVRDSGNFVKLDSLLATLPSLGDFFKKVASENPPKEEDTALQEAQVSTSPAVGEEIAEKRRSGTEGSDDVFLLSSVGEGRAHAQDGQQLTHQTTNRKAEHHNNKGANNSTFNGLNKPALKTRRHDKDLNKEERVPVVVLSPMPGVTSVRTNQGSNSTFADARKESYPNRRTSSIKNKMKGDAVKEHHGVSTDKFECKEDNEDSRDTTEAVVAVSSSSFSIDASSSEPPSSPSSSSVRSSCHEPSSASTRSSSSHSVFESKNSTLAAIDKDSRETEVRDQRQSVAGRGRADNRRKNIADVHQTNSKSLAERSSSESEGSLSSSRSSSSLSTDSFPPRRQRRAGSAVLQSTSSSSGPEKCPSSPQANIPTMKGNSKVFGSTGGVMTGYCNPGHAARQERHLATAVCTAGWAVVAQSNDLTLRLCTAKAGDTNEFASPPGPEWSVVERSGNLRLKLQRSSCRAKTPKSSHRASEMSWCVHRSGDCKLTFSGSLRKQQRRPELDSPHSEKNFGSRRKLKYL